MNRKLIRAALTGLVLSISGFANAGIIYEFVCDEVTCGGNTADGWGGYFEISEAGVAAGTLVGTAEIIDFNFYSNDALLTWTLANLDGSGISMTLDLSKISFIDSADSTNGRARFSNGGEVLYTTGSSVRDFGFTEQPGMWLAARQVPEPSILAIFALGILGLASRRFKK